MTIRLYRVTRPGWENPVFHVIHSEVRPDLADVTDQGLLARAYKDAGGFTATLVATSNEGAEQWSPEFYRVWLDEQIKKHTPRQEVSSQ